MENTNIAIFASGAGSNTRKLISYFGKRTSGHIALIVTNNPQAGVLDIARNQKIPSLIIHKKEMADSHYIMNQLASYSIQWIVLAGFLWKIPEYLINE